MPLMGRRKAAQQLAKSINARTFDALGPLAKIITDAIEDEAALSITRGAASGQKGGKHQHVPARPGEPPNEEWGDLRRGLESTQTTATAAEFRATAAHSVPLEFGTSKMAARPFVRPARDKVAHNIRGLIGPTARSLLKRAVRR